MKIAFRNMKPEELSAIKSKSRKLFEAKDFTNRFDITSIKYLPEYKNDNQAALARKMVPDGFKYNILSPKSIPTTKFGKEMRESNLEVKKNNSLSPNHYDIIRHYSNVSVSNIKVLDQVKEMNNDAKLLPQFEEMLNDKNEAIRTAYRVKGGHFPKDVRKNN